MSETTERETPVTELADFRRSKDQFILNDHDSPLTEEQRRDRHGLRYYDEDPDLSFALSLEPYDDQEIVELQTSTGDVSRFLRWGSISFTVDGEPARLTVYKDPDDGDYFLPFGDATSGGETYGAGRYLELRTFHNGQVLADFNYAYNPYCAYNEMWSCPLTPSANRLSVSIRAGEKAYK